MSNEVTRYPNTESNVTGMVSLRKDGQWAVVLFDEESAEVVSHVQIFPADRQEDAHALAKRWACVV